MAAISSLQIGGVTYDIYAKSAEQAPGSSHELSSHSHFSTYFNGTSANSALTSKSALSAGSAAKAASATSALTAGSADKVKLTSLDNASNYQVILGATGTQNLYYDSDLKIQYNTSSNTFYSPNISATNISSNTISAGKLTGTQFVLVSASATEANVTAANAAGVNALNNPKIGFWNSAANQKGYIIWSDYNNSNLWVNADSAFYGAALSDGFVVTSDQLNSILVSKNLSATNFKAPKISATNLTASNIVGTLNREYTSYTNGTAKVTDDTRWMWVCRLKGVTTNTYQHISILLNNSFWNTQQANSILLTFMYGRNGGQGDTVSVHCDRVSFIQKNSDLEFKYVKNPSDTIASNTVDVYIRVSSSGNSYGHWAAKVLNHGENLISNLVEWKWLFNQTLPDGAIDIPVGGSVASHTISSHSDSANFFSGNSARSACSATSAKNAGTATSAGTAANVNASQWTADSARYILFGENKASTTVGYDSDFTYNPSSNKLLVKNISSTNITATTFSGNLSGNATSAKNAGTATYATSAGAAPVASHNHNYTISAKTTAFNVSAGIQLSAGSNIDITSAGTKSIGISARNDIANASDKSTYFDGTSALYAKSATSATNAAKAADSDKLGGTAAANVIGSAQSGYKALTALSALSGIKNYSTIVFNSGTTLRGTFTPANSASTFTLVAGANVDFTTSGANTITITAKDSTYTTANFITATHLSNIQTASGYAADWNTNKTGLTNSAKSGWSAWSAVTANSSTWATNTDTKVSQTVTSDNVFYPILTKDSNGTTTVTAGARFADVVTVNPSTKMVRANKFGITSSATMEYNTATNSVDFIFN